MDELTTLDEKLTELNKNLKAIYSLLQQLPEIQAAIFLQMYDDYQDAKWQGLKAKDLWTVAEPQKRQTR